MAYRAWPFGFGVVKEYNETNDGQTVDFNPATYIQPLTDGIIGRMGWWFLYADPTVQSAETWTVIDNWFAQALANGKWIQIILNGGAWTPTWAINQLTQWNGSTGDWDYFVPDEGQLQTNRQGPPTGMLTSVLSNGTGTPIPFPWSANYQTLWDAFVSRFAARYAAQPHFRGMVVAGGGAYSSEMHLPDSDTASINQWIARGYTPTLFKNAYDHFANAQKSLFPNQVLFSVFHQAPPINDAGVRQASAAGATRALMAAAIDAVVGDQGAYGDAGLNANRTAGGYQLVENIYSGARFCFFQETTSSAKHPDTQDPNVVNATPAQAVTDVAAAGMGCGAGIMQIQWYEPTIMYDYLPSVIQSKSTGAGATNTTVALANALTTGSALIAVVVSDGTADPVFTGLTGWTKVASQAFNAGATNRVTVWTRLQQNGDGQSITATVSTATQIDLAVYEMTGLVVGGVITADAVASSQDAGGTVATLAVGPTATLAQAREWALIAFGLSGTSGGLVSLTGSFVSTEKTTRLLTGILAVNATTAQSCTGTWTNNRRAGGVLCTFEAAAAGPVSAALVTARAGHFARLTASSRLAAGGRSLAGGRSTAAGRGLS